MNEFRDRVKELRRVPASALRPHPRNWRTHPAAQREALEGVLGEVGFAGAVLARECEDGSLELIDGHLRAEATGAALVPVLVLDVTAEEAEKILLTHDPVGALAGVDGRRLDELLARTRLEGPRTRALLERLGAEAERAARTVAAAGDRPAVTIPEAFQVVVDCGSEPRQQALYARMREEGYRCRVLTL